MVQHSHSGLPPLVTKRPRDAIGRTATSSRPPVVAAIDPKRSCDVLEALWFQLAGELADPDVELDVDTFAPVCRTFHAMRRSGRPVDPMLAAIIGQLERQAMTRDDGADDNGRDVFGRREVRS